MYICQQKVSSKQKDSSKRFVTASKNGVIKRKKRDDFCCIVLQKFVGHGRRFVCNRQDVDPPDNDCLTEQTNTVQ